MAQLPSALRVPRGQAVLHPLTGALHGEVDDGRGAAPGRRARAGLEGVGREGAAERQLHVRVPVDATGDHVLAGGVDDAVGRCGQVGAEGGRAGLDQRGDALAVDQHVGRDRAGGPDDGAVGDEDRHGLPFSADLVRRRASRIVGGLVDLGLGDAERRGDAQHVAVQPALADQQPRRRVASISAAAASGHGSGPPGRSSVPGMAQLDGQHEALAPHLGHERVPLGEPAAGARRAAGPS